MSGAQVGISQQQIEEIAQNAEFNSPSILIDPDNGDMLYLQLDGTYNSLLDGSGTQSSVPQAVSDGFIPYIVQIPPAQSLNRVNPASVMDLNDITQAGTIFTANPNPNTNETHLISGTITRKADKAFCELLLITDDGSRFDLFFGNSIVPNGASIVGVTGAADTNDQDNLNIRLEGDNFISIDRTGSTADMTVSLSFWVKGLPDFQEYTLS